VGIGPAGDGIGVKHTSGMANCIPPMEQLANIISSLFLFLTLKMLSH
jgi:hypothetical protein